MITLEQLYEEHKRHEKIVAYLEELIALKIQDNDAVSPPDEDARGDALSSVKKVTP